MIDIRQPPAPITDNLLVNPGLEIWQRGAGPVAVNSGWGPDPWQLAISGSSTLSVSRNAVVQEQGSQYCAQCVYTHNLESYLVQPLEDLYQMRYRTLTLVVRVSTATNAAVRPFIWDSVNGYRYGPYHSGGGIYRTLTVTAPIAAAATGVRVGVAFGASCTAYVDSASLTVGAIPLPYSPLHPADDLARCLRYYEVYGGATPVYVVRGNSSGAGNAAGTYFFYRAAKPITPTVTKNGTWQAQNCAQPSIFNTSLVGFEVAITASAAGQFATYTDSADDTITIEANP